MPFPIWASSIPLVAAVGLWWLTGSPLVLAFAALGPVLAFAQRIDASRAERRQRAVAAEQTQSQTEGEAARLRAQQAAEIQAEWAAVATARQIVGGHAEQLRGHNRALVLGSADGRPVCTETTATLGLVGPPLLVHAMRRSIEVQLAHARHTDSGARSAQPQIVEAPTLDGLPMVCEQVIQLQHPHAATLWRKLDACFFVPQLLGRFEAERWFAGREHMRAIGPEVSAPLRVSCGVDLAGSPVSIDLVSGPHALVAGATGSGKTELLRAWIAALCSAHSPRELALVLFDYKGGSGFADLTALPQVAALVTDLDDADAQRALRSLGAELTRRERLLAAAGVREFDQLPPGQLPRLVVLIDEFQLLQQRCPEAQPVLADLAARGRAFGIHLVLCTQHPSQVVRDELSANCGLRLCLRVIAAAESQTMVGTTEAANLSEPGTVVMRSSAGHVRWKVASFDAKNVSRLVEQWSAEPAALSPWLPALPRMVHERQLCSLGCTGPAELQWLLCDELAERQYRGLSIDEFDRVRVLGLGGSGRSSALARFAECCAAAGEAVLWCVGDSATRWQLLAECAARTTPVTLIIDDLDDALAAFDPDYRQAWLETLRQVLRDRRNRVAWSSRGATVLDEFVPTVLQLDAASPGRTSWNGEPAQIVLPERPISVQAVAPAAWVPSGITLVVTRDPARVRAFARVSGIPIETVDARNPEQRVRLASLLATIELASTPQLLVADVEAWISLGLDQSVLLQRHTLLLLDGRLSDLRAFTRSSTLPPLLEPGEAWLLANGAAPERVQWSVPVAASGAVAA